MIKTEDMEAASQDSNLSVEYEYLSTSCPTQPPKPTRNSSPATNKLASSFST